MTESNSQIDNFANILFKYINIHNLHIVIGLEDNNGFIKDYTINNNKLIIKTTDKSNANLLNKDFSIIMNNIKQNKLVSILYLSNKYDKENNIKLLSHSNLIAIQIPVTNIDDLNIILKQFGFKTPNYILFVEKFYIICYYINITTNNKDNDDKESDYKKKLHEWLSSFEDIYPLSLAIPFPESYTYNTNSNIDTDNDTPVKCTLISCHDNFYNPYDVIQSPVEIYKVRYKSEMDYLKKNMFKHGFKSWQEKYKSLPPKLKEELDTYLHANGINVIDNYVSDTIEEIADHVSDIKLKTSGIMSFKIYGKQFMVQGSSVFSPSKFKEWYFYSFSKVINISSEDWNKFISFCSKAGKLNQASDVEDDLISIEKKLLDFISSKSAPVFYVDKWTDSNTSRDLVYLPDFKLYKNKNHDNDNNDNNNDNNNDTNTDSNNNDSESYPKEIIAIKYKHFRELIKNNLSIEPKAKDITRIKTYLETKNYIYPQIITRHTSKITAETFVIFIVTNLPKSYQDSIHENLINTRDDDTES